MVSKGDEEVVLWPRYFDQKLSRAQGRRVPENLAVRKPDVKWVASAAKKAGFTPAVEEDARDPAKPYEKMGRVLIKPTSTKEAAIRAVAEKMGDGSG